MHPTSQGHKLIFDTAPFTFLSLCKTAFPEARFSTAILPLESVQNLNHTARNKWLKEQEQEQFEAFRLEKRSVEWLGGRVSAKQSAKIYFQSMAEKKFIPDYVQCQVVSESSGRPFFAEIEGIALKLPELSISHSKGFAAAMSCNTFCGIDIQYAAETLVRVQEKFCNKQEEEILSALLPKHSTVARLTQLWSAKEAAKKMLSPTGIPGFHELDLQPSSSLYDNACILHFSRSNDHSPVSVQVVTTLFQDDYALAVCCAQPQQEVY